MTAEVSMTEETYGVVLDALASQHLRLDEQLKDLGITRPHEKSLREEQTRVRMAMTELLQHPELRRRRVEAMVALSAHLGARVPEGAGAQA
ncbi:MAG: hypothetical protein V4734_07730 [Terriglobus sp.]